MSNEEVTDLKTIVAEFSTQLGETERGPVRQIKLLIQYLGLDLVRAKVEETLQIEADGGMLTSNQERKRTPGGIFFYLIKEAMPDEMRSKVFPGYGQRRPKTTTIEWEQRMDYLEPLLNDEQGVVSNLELMIQGRPGRVEVVGDTVMLIMNHHLEAAPNQPNPRGVPQPSDQTQRYIVYMGILSWEKVVKFLEDDKDFLIIKGRIVYDPAVEGIAVFAIGVTTKEIERRNKQAAKAQEQREIAAKAKAEKQKTGAVKTSRSPRSAVGFVIPDGTPSDVAEKLHQLHQASETLRQRIATKLAAGQKPAMEEKLLSNNEKQIEGLLRQYS
jgi:hypothetical protein